tara:strand:+ start:32 stop:910 length:879 start_codon:yes stop_codon:yes gene_type:complete
MSKKKETKKAKVEQPKAQSTNETFETFVEESAPEKVIYRDPEVKVKDLEPKNNWEIKDRMYYLKGNKKPVSRSVKSSGMYWFDQEKGYERELKYCENQRTPFVDEMVGDQRLAHIIFRSGSLYVPKEKTVLQKLLSMYHPDRDKLYYEYKPVEEAKDELDILEMEIEALDLARSIDIDLAEAIMRVEVGSKVSDLSSKELKRDLLLFARRNPALFLELASDDNVTLRNFGIKAVELGIIKISADQRNFLWGSNGRKLMTVPFDEHPYTALAHWFKTDEGMEVYSSIEKRLNA